MSDLDDEARSLFDTARSGYEPNEEDGKRVLRRVLLRAGAIAAVTSATSSGAAAGAPLASGTVSSGVGGLVFKAALWLAIGGSVGIGGYAVPRVHSSSGPAATSMGHTRAGTTSRPSPSGPPRVEPRPAEVVRNAEDPMPDERAERPHPKTSRPKAPPVEDSP